MNYIISFLLGIVLTLEVVRLIPHKEEKMKIEKDVVKEAKKKELQMAFNNLMNYTVDKAINSKRGE